jgi:rod shape-determining protein MreC
MVSPIQSASSWASGTGGGFFRQITSFRSTAIENEALKQRLAETELELRNAREAKTENYRLQGLLALKAEPGPEKVFARVIARDASVWFNTIMINRGSASGVALNMPL